MPYRYLFSQIIYLFVKPIYFSLMMALCVFIHHTVGGGEGKGY